MYGKKNRVLCAAVLTAVTMMATACGSGTAQTASSAASTATSAAESTVAASSTAASTAAASSTAVSSTAVSTTAAASTTATGSTAVDQADVTAMAGKIQSAFADKDMAALADLCAYPVYVSSVTDNDGIINSKEDFEKLDPSTVFTDEYLQSGNRGQDRLT
jgi:predicted lipid-binding transport protein (Tim44 family)